MNYGLFSSGLKNADDPRRRKLAGSLEGVVGRARSARTMQDWYGELVQGIRTIDAFGRDEQDPLPDDEDKDWRQRFQRTMFDDTGVRDLQDYAVFRQPRDRGYDMLQEERMRDIFEGRNAPRSERQPPKGVEWRGALRADEVKGELRTMPGTAETRGELALFSNNAGSGSTSERNGAPGTRWWERAMETAFPQDVHPWQRLKPSAGQERSPRVGAMLRQWPDATDATSDDDLALRGGAAPARETQDDPFAGTLMAANRNGSAQRNGSVTDAGGGAGGGKAVMGRRTPPLEDFADPKRNILRPDKILDYYDKPGDITKLHETTGKGLETVSKSGSCGSYQLTGGTLKDFMKSPEAANLPEKYRALQDDPKAIAAAWPEMAREHPDALSAANEAYIQRTHYEPTLKAFEKAGLDTGSEAIQGAAFSMGVLRGGNAFSRNVAKHLPDSDTLRNMGVEEQLDALGKAFKMGYDGDKEVRDRVDNEFNGNLINLHRAIEGGKVESEGDEN
ncbi:hypothetical protein [Nitratidesulfovibrio sp. 1201_IL3209]|uniref:VgrG-related protein n=1 Tax=Nitratidesulfovibrio sp. 1201_IL3209 TaxID=3084053 RepID=UPI002FD94ED0